MTILKSFTLALALISASSAISAAEVETPGQAMSLCRAEAKLQHPDHKRIKSTKIKQVRSTFKITLKITSENEKVKSLCEVTRDGSVTYAKV